VREPLLIHMVCSFMCSSCPVRRRHSSPSLANHIPVFRHGGTRFVPSVRALSLLVQTLDVQKGVLTEARSCKHLRAFLGDAYEDARIAWKTQGSSGAPASSSSKPASGKKSTSAKKPASERKPTSSKKTTKRGRDAEDDDEEHEEQPKKKARPASTRSSKRMMKVEEGPEPDADEQVEEEDADMGSPRAEAEAKLEDPPATAAADDDQDELAEIDGIRPNKVLKDGEEHEAQSQTRSASSFQAALTQAHWGKLGDVQDQADFRPLLLVRLLPTRLCMLLNSFQHVSRAYSRTRQATPMLTLRRLGAIRVVAP
jgi:hypothetical protein